MYNYSYSAWGLNIESELECPEFQPGNKDTNNVLIEFGDVPTELSEPKYKGVRFESNGDEFLLKVDNVADYYVADKKITIHKKKGSDLDSVRVFLYGSAFAALLMQNGILPLHANALEKDGKAFLIAGNSGAGKSTLSTVLYKKGYNLLSDDVTALKLLENGKLQALPGIRYPKLWEKTLEILGEEKDELKRIRPELNKYRFTKIDNKFNAEQDIQYMFVIYPVGNREIETKEITSHKKLEQLLLHTFRKKYIYGKKTRAAQFFHFSQISDKMKLWTINRPRDIDTIDKIIEIIESKLEE